VRIKAERVHHPILNIEPLNTEPLKKLRPQPSFRSNGLRSILFSSENNYRTFRLLQGLKKSKNPSRT